MAAEGQSVNPSSSNSGSGTGKVKSGAWMRDLKAGITVKEARDQMSAMAPVPGDAKAYCGTQELPEDAVLEEGMQIEFIRKTGEKG
jgi:hypothetical protein